MDPRYSLKKYPRADNLYKSKSSLDFQLISANVYVNRKKNKGESAARWIIHLIIGLVIGIIAFYMSIMEEELIDIKKEYTQKLIDKFPVEYGYFFWASFSVLFALIGVVITVYIGPGASGSGVPEVIGMMNGVRYPKAIDIATLFVKIIGVEMAVIGNLAVGKEGPLVHIGAIVGAMTPYIPLDCFAPFRNDSDKRTFIAAGCSAGVSAAFGAPIGGALFTYEISKPNTFWTFSMLWRVFFSAAVATLTLGLCNELFTGVPLSLNSSSVLKFGEISYFDTPMFDAVIAVGLGVFCGILGAFFIYMYAKLGFLRKKFIKTPFKKIAEVIFFSLISATIFYWLSAGCNLCYPQDPLSEFTNYVSFTCPND